MNDDDLKKALGEIGKAADKLKKVIDSNDEIMDMVCDVVKKNSKHPQNFNDIAEIIKRHINSKGKLNAFLSSAKRRMNEVEYKEFERRIQECFL